MHAHCLGWYLGVHGSGVGAESGAFGSVKVPLGGWKGVSIRLGRFRQDVPHRCVGEGVHRGSCSSGSVCVRVVDIAHVKVLRSVY
jgi:hypothetical protein